MPGAGSRTPPAPTFYNVGVGRQRKGRRFPRRLHPVGLRVHPCESVVKIRIKTGNGGDRFSGFCTPFLGHKGLVSRRLREIHGKNYQGRKMKCETEIWAGLKPKVGTGGRWGTICGDASQKVGLCRILSLWGEREMFGHRRSNALQVRWNSTQVVDFPHPSAEFGARNTEQGAPPSISLPLSFLVGARVRELRMAGQFLAMLGYNSFWLGGGFNDNLAPVGGLSFSSTAH